MSIVANNSGESKSVNRPVCGSGVEAKMNPVRMGNMEAVECPCPSCGFYTTGSEHFGSYNICPICGWEDDGVQLANPASNGGANSKALVEHQKEALKRFPLEIQEWGLYKRDPRWRPLHEDETILARMEKGSQHWKNRAILHYHEAYWISE